MQVNLHDANRQYGPSHGTGLAGVSRSRTGATAPGRSLVRGPEDEGWGGLMIRR
jgi:hypothetical protein